MDTSLAVVKPSGEIGVGGNRGEIGVSSIFAALAAKNELTAIFSLRDYLVAWKAELRGTKKRQAAEALLGYVTERRDMVAYPEYLAAGRQIGSGPTESMGKATTRRRKGVGMRWDGDNAEAVMALEALDQSGEWQAYWNYRRQPAASAPGSFVTPQVAAQEKEK